MASHHPLWLAQKKECFDLKGTGGRIERPLWVGHGSLILYMENSRPRWKRMR